METVRAALLVLSWTFVCVDVCLSQDDCTGADCPRLHNCIETVLEAGACCPACSLKGCTCQGYQYYDCVQAGFRQGKVPERESYFVDFGSTECSCPQGGGKISCRFIPCPEIPSNCIEILQPADGCQQCGRIGCTHGSRTYEAGHSFQIDRCQVCHCPHEGGKLMCSPIPGCDLNAANEPVWATTEHSSPTRDVSSRRHSPKLENTLPLYKQDPPSSGTEDYDYSPAEPTSSTLQHLAQPLESTTEPLLHPQPSSASFSSDYDGRLEQREPERSRGDEAPRNMEAEGDASTTAAQQAKAGGRPPGRHQPGQLGNREPISGPTSAARIQASDDHRQAQTVYSRGSQDAGVSAKELVASCCETGHKWASTSGRCDNMEPPVTDPLSICWTAQQQCCRGSLTQSQCEAGVHAARAEEACEGADECGMDSYKDCCSCCSLGLRLRSEGQRCDAHRYLGFRCRHAFLTCCRGDEWRLGVRERPALEPTAPPAKVSDSLFPKEAFSLGAERDNAVEVEDMDECLIYEGNICQHRCVNTPGSYRCECFPGHELQDDGFTCAEAAGEENGLEEAPSPQPLVPLDPCQGNNPCEQHCSPAGGRPQCSCSTGFSLGPDGRSCHDVDECLSPGACRPDEGCLNTAGSYVCRRALACRPGYRVNKAACEDVNECLQRSHDCGPGLDCVNTEGSFRCAPKPRCPAGFSHDAQGTCRDTNECGTSAQACGPGFNCINTPGSYVCQRRVTCSRGFRSGPDGSSCVDVDECQGGLHRCSEAQLCRNLPGSYRCECQAGYEYDSLRRACVDVNECWRYPGRLCAQTCENTPGSYQCSCSSGFRLSGDGNNCEDVNECLSNPCSQECANVYGSYQCYCRQGYFLREDARGCQDIDECSQSAGHLCSYKCVNVAGSYRCACPESGYAASPDGRSCRDIDECDTGAHNCSLAQSCYNVQGGYRCLALDCPPNYRKVSNTRCERISCPNYLQCQNSPLRITYYYLSFQANIVVPAQIFRIGPSPAYSGDNVIVSITQGNEENYFSVRKLNAYTGALYLQRQVPGPRDFLVNVEMKLWRQGTFTTFHARIYVFITADSL